MEIYKKLGFAALFLVGVILVLTSNIQFAIGVALMVIGYSELRKTATLPLEILELVKKAINSTNSEDQAKD